MTGRKRTNTIQFHLYGEPRVVKFTETESRMVVVRGWGQKKDEVLVLIGEKASVWRM
jgi:hypothetical protein